MWGVFLALALACAFVAYIAYDPVPSECEPTQMVHITLGIMKAISTVVSPKVTCMCVLHV